MFGKSIAGLAACTAILVAIGCGSDNALSTDAQVELEFDPSPPVVGDTNVTLTLASVSGQPIAGAQVQLEGDMNHAGMKPSFADLEEFEPGRYRGTLNFTMGGDWLILVTATTSGGQRIEHKVDVRGVKQP